MSVHTSDGRFVILLRTVVAGVFLTRNRTYLVTLSSYYLRTYLFVASAAAIDGTHVRAADARRSEEPPTYLVRIDFRIF